MYGLGPSSAFLIIAVFLSVCTIGNSQAPTEYDTKCQGSVMKLKCLNKSYIIAILSVFYGRQLPGLKICRTPSNSYLSDEAECECDVSAKVEEMCSSKYSCNITVNDDTLGNSNCGRNVYKYMTVRYACVDRKKVGRDKEVERPAWPTPFVSSSSERMTTQVLSTKVLSTRVLSTEAIQPTSTLVIDVDRLSTIYQSQEATSFVSRSSSLRPHSVSVTTVSHTQRLPATSVAIESPSLKTTQPASKIYEHSATLAGQHGTMKLFRFILSFHIIREEAIHKNTASSVVWFMFGLLVGLFIMIAILVYYRVRQARREQQDQSNKVAYFKQKDCSDGTFEEKVILHPKELEVLEMESQLGETV